LGFGPKFSVEIRRSRCHFYTMDSAVLPLESEMLAAFVSRDAGYDGVFFTGVRTTGVFCRPSCPARKPRPDNIEFFPSARDALFSGYRPCKRCRPMEPLGQVPEWLAGLLAAIEAEPTRRRTDEELRAMGLEPDRVRRWFKASHGMTFHAYARARRLGLALAEIREGANVTAAAMDHGYESLSGFNAAFRELLGSPPTSVRHAESVLVRRLATPLGPMIAGATKDGLCLLEFSDRRMLERQMRALRTRLRCHFLPGCNSILEQAAHEVQAYFAGRRQAFDVPIVMPGSDFQRRVWEQLRSIPYGARASYGEVARAIGRPSAARAVARANGDNRIAIVVPCHRVVGRNGQLTGYAGGLWRKRKLLELESRESATGFR
jgi:AraC family transcriptional regulator of adaptative response/methylated-DNA-[protein]-cysteine methyltransferase